MKILQKTKLKGKKVLLRVDFNVPLKQSADPSRRSEADRLPTTEIEDDSRIKAAIPTIKYILEKGAQKIIIITHLGRPDGHEDKYCLWPIANRLMELLEIKEKYYDCSKNEYRISDKIIMLENLRFNSGEEKNDPEFAKELAKKADLFVNDAFGCSHRAHASIVAVAEILPSFAGLLVQKEVENLEKLIQKKLKKFTCILGGAKIKDKIPVIKNLISRADTFLIGGAIANTFLAARRHWMGKSLIEEDSFEEVNQIWDKIMDEADKNIFLPVDLILSKSIEKALEFEKIETKYLLEPNFEEFVAVDIGPKTIETFKNKIVESENIFWNGNMGISEVPEFAKGTQSIAQAVLESHAQVVIGGGDTVAAVESLGIEIGENIFLSTGGGATLEFLAGKELPGLKVLGYY